MTSFRCVVFRRPTLLELAPLEEFIAVPVPSAEQTAGWNRRAWVGIVACESLFVDGWHPDGDWTVLDIGLRAGCRVRTADLSFGEFEPQNPDERRTRRNVLIDLHDGPVTDTLLDPVRSFFRHPDEAGFWERITGDWCDATARLVYADWLDDHGDPHAWVFREPAPFASGYARFGWTGAARLVGHEVVGRRCALWEFAGASRCGRGVWFTLSDGTPVPPFVAYLLAVARIRAEGRFSDADRERLAGAVERAGPGGDPVTSTPAGCQGWRKANAVLWLDGDLLTGVGGRPIYRVTDPAGMASRLDRAVRAVPPPTPDDVVAALRAANGAEEIVEVSRVEYPAPHGAAMPALSEGDLDSLTGAGNRRAFDSVLTAALRRTAQAPWPLSVLSLDLDDFRRLNHSYGHQTGDRVLVEFTRRMLAVLGMNGFLARTGGDQFGVILPDTDLATAVGVAERMRWAVERWRWVAHDDAPPERPVTLSVGVATHVPGNHDRRVVEAADSARRRAQAEGRNRVCH